MSRMLYGGRWALMRFCSSSSACCDVAGGGFMSLGLFGIWKHISLVVKAFSQHFGFRRKEKELLTSGYWNLFDFFVIVLILSIAILRVAVALGGARLEPHDVLGLDVAVDVTARVDVRECVADVAKPARETRQARGERRDVESGDPSRAAPG